MKEGLSNQEQKCLDFINSYYKDHRVIPTHVAIADGLGIKTRQQITAIIKRLVDKSYLKKTPRHGLYLLK